MKKILMTLAILMVGAIGFTSCGDDEEVQPSQNEEKDEPVISMSQLVGRRFSLGMDDVLEYVDRDGDSLVQTMSRSIQFLNDSTAILYNPIETVYPEYPEWYSMDYGYTYLHCEFDGKQGLMYFQKLTIIMTGYFDERMTVPYDEPYPVWNFKIDENGKGIYIATGTSDFILMKEIEPIKGLQWQEFPPENGENDNLPDRVTDMLQALPRPIYPK